MSNENDEQLSDDEIMAELFQKYSEAFDELTYDRHTDGQQKYGVFTFLENDLTRMIAEELADAANYMRYQFIKLMVLNDLLADELEKKGIVDSVDGEHITIGLEAFKGVKDIGWRK